MLIKFNVPRKPFPSPRPRIVNIGGYPHAYFSKNYTIEKQVIEDLFRNDFGDGFSCYDGNLSVRIECRMPFPKTSFNGFSGKKADICKELNTLKPHNKKPDLDNIAKTYLDALTGIAWKDDSQISKLVLVKKWSFREEVLIEIDYTDINNKDEIVYFNDKLIQDENELVNKIYEERK